MSLNKFALVIAGLILCASAHAADIAISALPAATTVSGSDVIPIVQSGTTKKASFSVQQNLWNTIYQPLDGDLTALAALTGTHNIYYRSAANTWTSVTIGTGLDFTGATLSATGSGSAPANAHYLTNQSESGLSAEINLGALSTGLLKGTVSGSVSTISAITDNSSNWDTAFTQTRQWDGGATGLVAATGRTSLALVIGTNVQAWDADLDAFALKTAPSGAVVGTTDTQTFTNKRNTPRVTTITSSGTPTINTDNCDAVTITAQAAAITSMTTNLSGTPNNFDKLIIRIKDDGTARAITWGSSFVSSQATLPTTTVLSKVLTVGFIWDSVKTKWVCLATDQEP